jgi:hypothetical protein
VPEVASLWVVLGERGAGTGASDCENEEEEEEEEGDCYPSPD